MEGGRRQGKELLLLKCLLHARLFVGNTPWITHKSPVRQALLLSLFTGEETEAQRCSDLQVARPVSDRADPALCDSAVTVPGLQPHVNPGPVRTELRGPPITPCPQTSACADIDLSSLWANSRGCKFTLSCQLFSSPPLPPHGPTQAGTSTRVEASPGSSCWNPQSWDPQGPGKGGAGWSLRGCEELLSHLIHGEVHGGPGRGKTHSRSHRAGTEPEQESQSPVPPAQSLTWTHTASCTPGLGTESRGFLGSRSPFGALGRPPLPPVLTLPLL